ncbi:SRP72 [Candida theae]|uniref:Signal recognition particle subunit SRP72 n=1 Tax=Candida theae TaxID=1198502 RepID=A0AAD5G046_9ASCO|nr:SRP72 [Candida theae]KAI5964433.1 SRP72 [Candida theae]
MSKSIVDAFNGLKINADSSPSELKQIYQVSYEYLSKVKNFNDLQSFKNCLVALINLDSYGQATKLITKVPGKLIAPLILEITYVYYKIGKTKDILRLYQTHETKIESNIVQTGFKHILAQTYYKIGEYQKALELYKELISEPFDSQSDLLVNEQAIISQLIFQKGEASLLRSSLELDPRNYDMLFNEAIIEVAKANLTKALQLLQQAHKVCSENNLSDEDVETELLPINLTIAYVYQIQGKSAESDEILSGVNASNVHDTLLKLILKNNIQSEKPIGNANLIERQLNYQENIQKVKQKITVFQLETILKNSLVLRFATGTVSNSQLNSESLSNLGLVPAAYNALSKTRISYRDLKEARNKVEGKKLVQYIQKETRSDLKEAAILLLVQINSHNGSFDQSLPFLEKLAKESQSQPKFSPGIIGTLMHVYEATRSIKKLKTLLTELTEKLLYATEEAFKDENYYNCAKIIAMKNYSFNNDSSKQLFEFLHSSKPDDELVNSLLSNTNDNLLPISELESSKSIDDILSIDLNELIPTKAKTIQPVIKKSSKITKKKRAPKFGKAKVIKPEGEFKLDDERWLPLKLRSYYKPTKKDKKKMGGGHQGAVEASPAPAVHTSSGSSGNKKKKKKGKK